jgi:hypothetical protein
MAKRGFGQRTLTSHPLDASILKSLESKIRLLDGILASKLRSSIRPRLLNTAEPRQGQGFIFILRPTQSCHHILNGGRMDLRAQFTCLPYKASRVLNSKNFPRHLTYHMTGPRAFDLHHCPMFPSQLAPFIRSNRKFLSHILYNKYKRSRLSP